MMAKFLPGDKLWVTAIISSRTDSADMVEYLIAGKTKRDLCYVAKLLNCDVDPKKFMRRLLTKVTPCR